MTRGEHGHERVKLDDDKTEEMIVSNGVKSMSLSSSFKDSMSMGNASVSMSNSAENLGDTPDCHLTMKTHISNLVSSVNFELRRITSIRHALPTDAPTTTTAAATTVVVAGVRVCRGHQAPEARGSLWRRRTR